MGGDLLQPSGSTSGAGAAATVDAGAGVADASPDHRPIGEVLSLLQEEFKDVTISKIRFLESQGLIRPERTASGYRRFSSADIERLQWILRQQRDHFLPLKVIRRMLDEGVDRYDPGSGAQPTLFSSTVQDAAERELADEDDEAEGSGARAHPDQRSGSSPAPRSPAHPAVASAGPPTSARPSGTAAHPAGPDRAPAPGVEASGAAASGGDAAVPSRSRRAPGRSVTEGPNRSPGDVSTDDPKATRAPHETPADVVAALQEDPRPGRGPDTPPRTASRPVRPPTREPVPDDVQMTAEDLCRVGAIDQALLGDLERFGLVQSTRGRAGEHTYGHAAVEVVRLAARYAELGIEARHLRMYLVAAEREAGMVEQLAIPLLKQRNPRAREHAAELASELAELGADLHRVLLRREVGHDLLP